MTITEKGTPDRYVDANTNGGGGGGGTDPVSIKDGVDPTRKATVDASGNLQVAVSNFPAEVEVKNDSGNPVPVSGTVGVNNFPSSVEVSNDAGNPLPVSGPLTDAQLRATAVPVSVGEVEVKNDAGNPLAVSGPLTDTQLRATSVPVADVAAEDTLASKLDPITPFSTVVGSSGDNLLLDPLPGNRLQIRWIYAQAKVTNSNTVIATFKSSSLGDHYKMSLEASQPFSHSAVIDLAIDETFLINLDVTGEVIVNVDYREV